MQKKYKFQVIDALILLLILALLAGFVYLFIVRPYVQVPAKTSSVVYTVSFRSLDPEVAKKAKIGDTVFDFKSDSVLGKIEKIQIEPTKYEIASDHQTTESKKHPEHVTLTLTIQATLKEKTPVTVDGIVIKIGSSYTVKTIHFTGNGTCQSLKVQ